MYHNHDDNYEHDEVNGDEHDHESEHHTTKTMIIVTSEFRKLLYHIIHHDHYVGMPDILALTVVTKFIYILTMTI